MRWTMLLLSHCSLPSHCDVMWCDAGDNDNPQTTHFSGVWSSLAKHSSAQGSRQSTHLFSSNPGALKVLLTHLLTSYPPLRHLDTTATSYMYSLMYWLTHSLIHPLACCGVNQWVIVTYCLVSCCVKILLFYFNCFFYYYCVLVIIVKYIYSTIVLVYFLSTYSLTHSFTHFTQS